ASLAACTARVRPATPTPAEQQSLAPGETDQPGASADASGGDGGDGGSDLTFDPNASLVEAPELTIQLTQFPNARAAGFMAADVQGYYSDEQLEVLLNPALPGDTDPVQAVLAEDGPQFLFASAALVMTANAKGADLVNIAQIY